MTSIMSKDTKESPAAKQRMTLDEYRDRLHNYNQRFLDCKDLRHVWKLAVPYTSHAENADWVFRTLECRRCGTTRTDWFRLDQREGRLVRGYSSYRYPSGFSMRGLPEVKRLSDITRYESYLRALTTVNGASAAKESK